MTLVMLAAAGGHDDLLRVLIRKGAKVNGRQKNGTTALIHAAEKVGLFSIIFVVLGSFMHLQKWDPFFSAPLADPQKGRP